MTAMPRVERSPIMNPAVVETGAASAAQFADAAYRQHFGTTYAAAMRMTRDSEAAADMAQEAYLRLLAEARQGRRPDNTAAWLCRAATNVAISRGRRTTVARRLAPRLIDRSTPDEPEAMALEREQATELHRILAALRPAERRALVLASQGMSGAEIAKRIGRTHGATRALMCRARAMLRNTAEVPSGPA